MRLKQRIIMQEEITRCFGKKVIYCNGWLMVYSKTGLSQPLQDMLKVHYNVSSITIVLEDK